MALAPEAQQVYSRVCKTRDAPVLSQCLCSQPFFVRSAAGTPFRKRSVAARTLVFSVVPRHLDWQIAITRTSRLLSAYAKSGVLWDFADEHPAD